MSVICKVSISEIRPFGEQKLVKTTCVSDNEIMAAYNPSEEDKLFTKYSPSGSADFTVPVTIPIPQNLAYPQPKLYLMFVQSEVRPEFSNSLCFAKIKVNSSTDFGGQSKQFDIGTFYQSKSKDEKSHKWIEQFNHRIMIDNPAAADQFIPGDQSWWIGIYDADKFTMSEVISDAHSGWR